MSFYQNGFCLINEFIPSDIAESICKEADTALKTHKGGGIRNANKKFASIASLAHSDSMLKTAADFLNGKPFLVRAILFDKSEQNNWLVTWHQDKTVALSEKFSADQWGPWSIKDGTHHVQPPLEVLDNMVTFRIHIDEASIRNGCLRVVPGSHKQGILSQSYINTMNTEQASETIEAPKLSALVMRPHILHASSKATHPSRRRVLHLEYSSFELPEGVTWA